MIQGGAEKRLLDDKETDGAAVKKGKFEVCKVQYSSFSY